MISDNMSLRLSLIGETSLPEESMDVNANKSDIVVRRKDSDADHSSSDHSSSVELSPTRCQRPASQHAIYLASLFFFMPYGINRVTFNSIVYNKLCYDQYENTTLCADKTFISQHPDLQVRPAEAARAGCTL